MSKTIKLSNDYQAIVDDEDYERLRVHRWKLLIGIQVRVVRYEVGKIIYMHYDVLQIKPRKGFEVDHIDREPLNNQKANLRLVTHTDNMRNTKRHLNRVGYCWNWRSNSYIVYLDMPDKKRKYLGYRKTLEEAKLLLEEAKLDNN